MFGAERGDFQASVVVDGAVVHDLAADPVAQCRTVRGKPAGQGGDRLRLRQEHGRIGVFEVPAAQVDEMRQSVRVVAVHVGDENGLCGFHGNARGAHPVDRHDAHINKIPLGVRSFAEGDHCARALPMCFRHAMACS